MKTIAPALLAVALLALPATASAKGVMGATVCGASGCTAVKDPDQLVYFAEGGDPVEPPAQAAEWYRATLTIGAEGGAQERFSIALVPDLRLIRGFDEQTDLYTWMPVSEEAASAYRKVAAGLEPFPAASLKGVEATAAPTSPPPSGDDAGGLPGWALPAALVALASAGLALVLLRARAQPLR